MKLQLFCFGLLLGCLSNFALAHSGVKDPQVMARMNTMSAIATQVKILGDMSKGAAPFDARVAAQAAQNLLDHAERVIGDFTEPAQDPKSEAAPQLWNEFSKFSSMADALTQSARGALAVETPAQLTVAVRDIGRTCAACHNSYRIKVN